MLHLKISKHSKGLKYFLDFGTGKHSRPSNFGILITILLVGSLLLSTTALAMMPLQSAPPRSIRLSTYSTSDMADVAVLGYEATPTVDLQTRKEKTIFREIRVASNKKDIVTRAHEKRRAIAAVIQKKQDSQIVKRINRYLSGSPLAGRGSTFVAAAHKYGVNPLLSPAISTIESGKGRHCANRYNAWGMRGGHGWQSFSSWDDAIYSHVRLIGTRYGKGSTPESMAKHYCPPTWQHWARKVRGEMSHI